MVTVLLGNLPGSGSGDWRPGFSLLSVATPIAPPSSVPLKAAFQRVVRTYFSFPGQLPGLCCPALGNPLVLLFGFFPGMPILQGRFWRLRNLGCACEEEAGLGEQPHCLCSAMCAKRFLASWEPLLLTPQLTRCLSCLPAEPHIFLSNDACINSKGLELHKVELVLRARKLSGQGLRLALAPNGCAINRTYQRSMHVSV